MKKFLIIAIMHCLFLQAVAYTYLDNNGIRWQFTWIGDPGAENIQFYEYPNLSYSTNIKIPEEVYVSGGYWPVVSIAESAFKNYTLMTGVTIPSSMEKIGASAFYGCTGLTSVTIPLKVSEIGTSAFRGCSGLSTVTINSKTFMSKDFNPFQNLLFIFGNQVKQYNLANGIDYIGNHAFSSCTGLSSVTSQAKKIGEGAFSGCTNLTSVTFSIFLSEINSYAFYNCSSLTSVVIPKYVKSIGQYAYSGCTNLTSISVDSDNSIFDSRNNCNAIIETASNTLITGCKTTVIPNTVTSIGENAFENCSDLRSITIPKSVTSIRDYAFRGCNNLTSVCVRRNVPVDITADVFTNRANATLYVPYGSLAEYQVADYWKEFQEIVEMPAILSIEDFSISAGETKEMLIDLNNPDTEATLVQFDLRLPTGLSIAMENGEPIVDIAGRTTWRKHSLQANDLGGVTRFLLASNSNAVITGTSGAIFSIMLMAGSNFNGGAITLEEQLIVAPDASETYPDDYTYSIVAGSVPPANNIIFADAAVKALCVENWDTNGDGELSEDEAAAVTDLNKVFSQNSTIESFEELSYFKGLTSIRAGEFRGCSSLTSITIPENVATMSNLGGSPFEGCSVLERIRVESNNTIFDSRNNCNAIIKTATNVLIAGCKNTIIPNNVTAIGRNAFKGCSGLTTIIIPESVTTINYAAFEGCTDLESVIIPEGVTSIGNDAFYGCSSLLSVTIPVGVITINEAAFEECNNLTSVIVNIETPLPIGEYTFTNRANATLYVPIGCKAAYEEADYWKEFKMIVELAAIVFADANVKALCVQNWDTNGDGELSTLEAGAVTSLGDVFKGNTEITSFNELQYFTRLTTIGDWTFFGCSGLASVVIPTTVTSIGSSAFWGSGLTSIAIPNSVTTIADRVFVGCESLTSVTIPASVTSIGEFPFVACGSLESIVVDSDNDVYDSRNDCNAIIETVSNTLIVGSINTIIPNTVTTIGDQAFNEYNGLIQITIPEGVESIGESAFCRCTNLKSVTMPSSLESIGYRVFYGDNNLDYVEVNMASPINIYSDTFSSYEGVTLYVPFGSKPAYMDALYWQDFNIQEKNIAENVYYIKNVETSRYLDAGNAWGTHTILGSDVAAEALPVLITKQDDGSYTLFCPERSYSQQLIFRDSEEGVYVDYQGQDYGCPYWTITDAGNGNYFIQTLTTHPTYGQEAMPGTYLGNNPTKPALGGGGEEMGNFDDVDGNVLNVDGMNILWTLEVAPSTEAQHDELQDLISQAELLEIDAEDAESLLNSEDVNYYTMMNAINTLREVIIHSEMFHLGDVNGSGGATPVTPADAIMILYHYFGVAQNGFIKLAADVNGDSNISPADAIEALYIYFGASGGNGNARAARPEKEKVNLCDPE